MPRDIIPEGDGLVPPDIRIEGAVSTPSPKRKPGRPQKASSGLTTNLVLPTGAPIAETPREAAGGGQLLDDVRIRDASPHSNEIGSNAVADETGQCPFDTQQKIACLSAHQTPPSVAVGGGPWNADDLRTSASPTTNTAAAVLDAGDGGEVRGTETLLSGTGLPDLASIIDDLINLQKERINLIRTKNKLANGVGAYVRDMMGVPHEASEKERADLSAKALEIIRKVEKGTLPSDNERPIAIKCEYVILAAKKAREPFENALRAQSFKNFDGTKATGVEQRMAKLAQKLPVWQWAKEIKGFGPLGLAVIVAEAGDLSNYANPGKLWKRMGLAPYNGKSGMAWRMGGGLTSQEWIDFKYSPARRSEMFQRVDPLMKHQISKVKDADGNDTGERIYGPYGAVYRDRKQYEIDRDPEISKRRAHDRATRYMEKRLLKHLWQAWRRQPIVD